MKSLSLALAGALLIGAACSGDDDAAPVATAAPTTVTPVTSAAPTSATPTSPRTPTTVATTVATTAATTAATTTVAAPTTTATAVPLPQLEGLEQGVTYRVARAVITRAMQFTSPADGLFGLSGPGIFGLTQDTLGIEPLVTVTDLTQVRAFADPLTDYATLQDNADLQAATTDVPADYLAWFAALPGVTAGPVEDTEFAGFPARRMTWEVGPFDGGYPCFGSDRGSCVLTLWAPVGAVLSYWTGDSGTVYVVEIDGRDVVVEVTARDGADEAAASIVIGE